jgi:putative FmdB family regulatory protein
MPTYDYRCSACNHEFEQFQSMKDKVLRSCPRCKKLKLERLIGTGGAIIFKGSGFYQTDYRSEGYKKAADAEKPAESAKTPTKAESKSDAKADAAPAGSSESKPAASVKSDSKPAKPAKAKPDGTTK